jgi:UDP-N-acetylmuramoyl-L-alanyl-D-glutamate--2,6-diaminopimelate ligase
MRLAALLEALPASLSPPRSPARGADPVIRGITYDSRAVSPGDLFVALVGTVSDGHDYLEAALRLGAAALLVQDGARAEQALLATGSAAPAVVVPDSRRSMAPVAARFFGEPASELTLVGVTGTNGKTSTTYLVESILRRANRKTGVIGTVSIRYGRETLRAVNTTPESLDLQRVLRAMRTHDVDVVVMEVSSHGLELGRVNGCRFQVGAITNVTQDHLDFHGTMDAYLESKLRLFREHLAKGGAAVINVDDPSAPRSIAAASETGARVIRATRRPDREAEVALVDADVSLAGTRARVRLPGGTLELAFPLLGSFNLENLVVACGIATALEIPLDAIVEGVAHCPQVPGRMELVAPAPGEAPTVIVDYAHTPDAVEKLLDAVRPLTHGRLITVFGCGGDRDRAKRPLMARAVARASDRIIATSDNPRTEDPERILQDVETGLADFTRVSAEALDAGDKAYAIEIDRRAAIDLAVRVARKDDTVVIAGKGHEDYQIVGRTKLPFDDREEAGRALAEWRRNARGTRGSGR